MRVPEDNLVGTRGAGFLQTMKTSTARISIAALSTVSRRAHTRRRKVRGRPRAVREADFEVRRDPRQTRRDVHRNRAARQLTHKSAWSVDNDADKLTQLASMAKEKASRVAVETADEAVQIHGVAGYVNDFDVERFTATPDHPDLRGDDRDPEEYHRPRTAREGHDVNSRLRIGRLCGSGISIIVVV